MTVGKAVNVAMLPPSFGINASKSFSSTEISSPMGGMAQKAKRRSSKVNEKYRKKDNTGVWKESYHDKHERYYYRNLTTGRCTWDEPPTGATHVWYFENPTFECVDQDGEVIRYADCQDRLDLCIDSSGNTEAQPPPVESKFRSVLKNSQSGKRRHVRGGPVPPRVRRAIPTATKSTSASAKPGKLRKREQRRKPKKRGAEIVKDAQSVRARPSRLSRKKIKDKDEKPSLFKPVDWEPKVLPARTPEHVNYAIPPAPPTTPTKDIEQRLEPKVGKKYNGEVQVVSLCKPFDQEARDRAEEKEAVPKQNKIMRNMSNAITEITDAVNKLVSGKPKEAEAAQQFSQKEDQQDEFVETTSNEKSSLPGGDIVVPPLKESSPKQEDIVVPPAIEATSSSF